MRIRNFRFEDMSVLAQIQQVAAETDVCVVLSEEKFAAWISNPALDALSNVLVITDDDDELNTWGQAGTLEGIEGEIIGYTVIQSYQEQHGYYLLCQGAVLPEQRRRHAGRALLICALNRARMIADEFAFEAELAGVPVYFAALLPLHDAASVQLAQKCEMQLASERVDEGWGMYQCEL